MDAIATPISPELSTDEQKVQSVMMELQEAALIARTPFLITRASLRGQLAAAGLSPSSTVLVHTSLGALGWVAGGAVALIQALEDQVGPDGTVVMPTHSNQLTDPAGWDSPPVPAGWIPELRANMPAYDPRTTPTRSMGVVAELFRTWPGAERSAHPSTSFAAAGRYAGRIVADHHLESPLGERSPLARLHELDATVLLLGVGFDVCTMLHLAEQRAWPARPKVKEGAPLLVDGVRRWVNYETAPLMDPAAFVPVGGRLLEIGLATRFPIGSGTGLAMSTRPVVDWAAAHWSATAPRRPPCGP